MNAAADVIVADKALGDEDCGPSQSLAACMR